MVNLIDIIDRLKHSLSLEKNYEVADLLGLSPADFSKRKKTGTLLPLIIELAISKRVNLEWLLRGENVDPSVFEPSDLQLIGDIIESLETILQEEGTNLPPDKKRRLIELLYQRFRKTGEEADKDVMREHLRLIAA